jgi:hypothetical protein
MEGWSYIDVSGLARYLLFPLAFDTSLQAEKPRVV